MSGTTPVSSYHLLNNATDTLTVWKAGIDGNSVADQRISAAYLPYGSTAMTVNVAPGSIWDGTTLTESSAWVSSAIAAPVSNSRIDRIVLDQLTGTPSIVTGSAGVSPSAPAIPTGKVPCAQIVIASTTTALGNSLLTDERNLGQLGGNYAGIKLLNYAADTGSTNAFAIAPVPAVSSYVVGIMGVVMPVHGQTSSATLAISGLTATTIKTPWGTNISSGMMSSGGGSIYFHDGTNFQLLNPITNDQTIVVSDITVNNMSSAAHGFAPKGDGSSNSFVNGKGTISVPGVPINSQSSNYTTVLGDNGMTILHPAASTGAFTWTIASNGSVAYPVQAAITFVNQNGAGSITITSTGDIVRTAGTGSTADKVLAANGVATALKIATTEWIISGAGLT